MKTLTHTALKDKAEALLSEDIIKKCVHCGFCNAHCPTYQLLGDERDGPRGRIYLIKQMLEENDATEKTRTHLDRCLTCRACETVCPAGVEYGQLIHVGRKIVEEKSGRPLGNKIVKSILSAILPYENRVAVLFGIGRLFKPFLPRSLSSKIPPKQERKAWVAPRHERKMIALAGCAQAALTPATNQSLSKLLDRLGISVQVEPAAGCCGAVDHHMGFEDRGKNAMRHNIDTWWPAIENGIEAIIISASACSLQIKEYGHVLKDDPVYAEKAKKVSALAKDVSEIFLSEDLRALRVSDTKHVAVHCPCTLQNGQSGAGSVEKIFSKVGISLSKTKNSHICCGSAGTYSLQQPAISTQLLNNKIKDLTIEDPGEIVTSNIGCQLHIGSKAKQPVSHWVEFLDKHLKN